MSRKIEKAILVAAPPDEVWRALTDAEMIGRWFAPEARVTPGEGGSIWMSWGPGCDGEAQIEQWQPHQRLITRDLHKPIAVEYILEGQGGTTRLRLVQTVADGPEWDDEYDSSDVGWTIFLAALQDYFARHRGAACRQANFSLPIAGELAGAWRRLQSLRAAGGLLDGEEVWSRHERPMALVLELAPLDLRVHLTLERVRGESFARIGLFAYAAPAARVDVDELAARWRPLLESTLGSC